MPVTCSLELELKLEPLEHSPDRDQSCWPRKAGGDDDGQEKEGVEDDDDVVWHSLT